MQRALPFWIGGLILALGAAGFAAMDMYAFVHLAKEQDRTTDVRWLLIGVIFGIAIVLSIATTSWFFLRRAFYAIPETRFRWYWTGGAITLVGLAAYATYATPQ